MFSREIRKTGFMLDLRRLRLLHALAMHETVAAAAKASHLTGPAVSQQLAALERETGVRLVERNGRRLKLTDAGRVLVAHTGIVLDQLAAAEADLVALGSHISGTVSVAAFSSSVATLLADAWGRLRARHGTRIRLQITTLELEEALPALQRGDADLVVAYSYQLAPTPTPPPFERHHLLTDPVVLAVPHDDPLGAPGTIELATLSDRDWILPHAATACHQMLERACGTAGFVPHPIAHCVDFPAMLSLVAAGAGIALVPLLAAYHLPEAAVLHPIDPPTSRDVFAITRPGGDRRPATKVLLDYLSAAAHAPPTPAGDAAGRTSRRGASQ